MKLLILASLLSCSILFTGESSSSSSVSSYVASSSSSIYVEGLDDPAYSEYYCKYLTKRARLFERLQVEGLVSITFEYCDKPPISYKQWQENNKFLLEVVKYSKYPSRREFLHPQDPYTPHPSHSEAIYIHNKKKIKELLAIGEVDVNARDEIGSTALIICSCRLFNEYPDIIELLVKNPDIEINASNNIGYTALSGASLNGHYSIVKLLLRHPRIDSNNVNEVFINQKPNDISVVPFLDSRHITIESANKVLAVLKKWPPCVYQETINLLSEYIKKRQDLSELSSSSSSST